MGLNGLRRVEVAAIPGGGEEEEGKEVGEEDEEEEEKGKSKFDLEDFGDDENSDSDDR